MLVRTNSILLFWSAFPAQPMKVLAHVPSIKQSTPDSTAQSANTSICSSEYGIITSITSVTLDVPTILMQQVQEDILKEDALAKVTPIEDAPTEDAIDSFSACPDLHPAQDSVKDTISISSVPADEISLPDVPPPVPAHTAPINEDSEEIIYHKRREDYYLPSEPIAPHFNNVLGTKIHNITLDDKNGMPVFKPNTDKTKPRAMLRRLKTMVRSKNKLYLL